MKIMTSIRIDTFFFPSERDVELIFVLKVPNGKRNNFTENKENYFNNNK